MTEVDIPAGAVVLNVLHVVEYMDTDGTIYKQDFSHTNDSQKSELALGKSFELIEWARALTTSSLYMDMIHDYAYGEDDDDEDEGVEV